MHTATAIQNTANMRIFLSNNTMVDGGGRCTVNEGTPYKHGSRASSSRSLFARCDDPAVELMYEEGESISDNTSSREDLSESHNSA